MRTDVPTQTVSDLQPFQASPFRDAPSCSLSCCQISQDGQWAWIAKGCSLEVYSLQKVERKSFWCYKTEPRDPLILIGGVTEFTELHSAGRPFPRLLISLDGVNLLCLFDVQSSKVIRAIQMPKKVVQIEVIATEGGACVRTRPLARELRYVFGLVAVAFEDGNTALVDMCLDEDVTYSTEFNPGDVCFISLQSRNIAQIREAAILDKQHLVFLLNDNHFRGGTFVYLGPESEVFSSINSEAVAITSIAFIPHLTLLALGFNFGGLQFWNLQALIIEYTFKLDEQLDPVVRFAFQEPENDPRNYCYIWVVRGQLNSNNCLGPKTTSVASLFSLGYSKKEWISGYGFLYHGLQNCVHRLDYPLTTAPLRDLDLLDGGSRLVAFRCIQQGEALTVSRPDIDELHSEEFNNQDLSLCVMVWEAWIPNKMPEYFLAVFDLNQWYQAQMPSQFRALKGKQCSYLGIFSLAEIQAKLESSSLLDVQINASSLVKYKTLSNADEMYYPASLAFKTRCLTDAGILNVAYLGMQRQVLWEVEMLGPNCLTNPNDLHSLCIHMGLLPRSSELISNASLKRESLLTLALDNNLLNFITGCVWQWASMDNVKTGCTLKFLLGWIWNRVTHIKNNSDKLCLPLFNCSGQELDPNSLSLLHSYATQLEHLTSVLKIMQNQSGPITETGLQELLARQEVSNLLSIYLRIILWLYYCSLLPEHAEGEAYGENEVAFPVSVLKGAYNQRRKELRQLHAVMGQTDLLLIDGMITQLGDNFPTHWEKSGANYAAQYPPPSLYALLSTYLMKGPTLEDKHCLMLYLLLDMAAFLSDRQCHLEEKLMQFPAAFRISHSRIKLTQGFWMLDHKEFEEAISFFTDPVINCCDILPWQHTRILKSFLYQGEHQKALRYIHICKPPLHTPEEVKLHLTVLLANKLVAEAFQYQKQCCDERNTEDLLNHFFMGCQQTGNMDALLKLPFSLSEEESLVQFLFGSSEKFSKDMLVMYFLQRSQPLEASRLNDKLKPLIMETESFKERAAIRSALVSGFLTTLPDTQKRLAAEVEAHHLNIASNFRKTSCPAPLSTTINCNTVHIISQSSRLQELMSMVKETWSSAAVESPSPIKPKVKDALVWATDTLPFIETPSSKRKPKKRESEIIYATPIAKRSFSMLNTPDSVKIPNKRSRAFDYSPTSAERGPFMRPISVEVLSLLQTPPIKRKIPAIKPRVIDELEMASSTPPSILKVRRSKSPHFSKLVSSATKRSLQLGKEPVENTSLRETLELEISTEGETDKMLRFHVAASSSKGSITGSEWSTTPENETSFGHVLPRSPAIPSSIRSRLNLSADSDKFCENMSLHTSDLIVEEDDEVTFNYSIQKRREIIRTNESILSTQPESSIPTIPLIKRNELPSLTKKALPESPPSKLNASASLSIAPKSPKPCTISSSRYLTSILQPNASKSESLDVEMVEIGESFVSDSSDAPPLCLSASEDEFETDEGFVPQDPNCKVQLFKKTIDESLTSSGDGSFVSLDTSNSFSDTTRTKHVSLDAPNVSGNSKPNTTTSISVDVSSNAVNQPINVSSGSSKSLSTSLEARRPLKAPLNVSNASDASCELNKVSSNASSVFFDDLITSKASLGDRNQSLENSKTSNVSLDAKDISKNDLNSLKTSLDDRELILDTRKTSNVSQNEPKIMETSKTALKADSIIQPIDENDALCENVTFKETSVSKENTPERSVPKIDHVFSTVSLSRSPLKSSSMSIPTEVTIIASREIDVPEKQSDVLEVVEVQSGSPSGLLLDASTSSDNSKRQSSPLPLISTPVKKEMATSSHNLNISDVMADEEAEDKEKVLEDGDDQKLEIEGKDNNGRRELFVETRTTVYQRVSNIRNISPISSVMSQSLSELSPTTSVQSESSIFITPEKVSPKTSPQVWSSRLRPRSRTESLTSDSGSPTSFRKNTPKNVPNPNSATRINTSTARRVRTRARINLNDSCTFVFAPPTIPEEPSTSNLLDTSPATNSGTPPALPFVFSPPVTRSRLRRKKLNSDDSMADQSSMFESSMISNDGASDIFRRPNHRKSRNSVAAPPWENFINVISPAPPELRDRRSISSSRRQSVSGAAGSQVRTSLSRHGMQLRTEPPPVKTRKKVKL